MKICRICCKLKQFSEYHRDKTRKDGYRSKCKNCVREYNKDRLDKRRIADRKRRAGLNFKKPSNTKTHKYCIGCHVLKSFNEFYYCKYTSDKLQSRCKKCNEERRKENFNHVANVAKARVKRVKGIDKNIPEKKVCPTCNVEKSSDEFNKSSTSLSGLRYRCRDCQKKSRIADKDNINRRRRTLYKNNIEFKLRARISSDVSTALKNNYGSKNGNSILKYLPYTIKELKCHLESLWELWMNWDNYGKANINKKTWQIDHIIPQSKLPYDSMDHPNFLKCWSLENLRPLEAIINIKKGNR